MTQQQSQTSDWAKVHDEYCRSHDTLVASVSEVMAAYSVEGQELPFSLPRKNTVLVNAAQVATALQQQQQQTVTSTSPKDVTKETSSSMWGWVWSRGGSGKNDDDDEEYEEWSDQQDVGGGGGGGGGVVSILSPRKVQNTRQAQLRAITYKTPIYNLSIIRAAIRALEQKALVEAACNPYGLQMVEDAASNFVIVPVKEWLPWVSEALTAASQKNEKEQILGRLPFGQKQLLLTVLIDANQAKVMKGMERLGAKSAISSSNSQEDLVILSGAGRFHQSEEEQLADENTMKKFVAFWDLQRGRDGLERRAVKLEQMAKSYKQQALQYNKEGKKKLAVNMLRHSKQVERQLNLKYDQMAKIRDVQVTIETMQADKGNLDLMAQSAALLKNVRESQEMTAEQVDQVRDDLVSEMDLQRELQEATAEAAGSTSFMSTAEEDSLLRELDGLMDLDGPADNGGGGDGGEAKKQEEQKKKEENDARLVDDLEERLKKLLPPSAAPGEPIASAVSVAVPHK